MLSVDALVFTASSACTIRSRISAAALRVKVMAIISSMVVEGRDNVDTAMAITVGLPVAIGCKLILEGKIKDTGVKIPTSSNIYKPILEELGNYGIVFKEEKIEIPEPNGE